MTRTVFEALQRAAVLTLALVTLLASVQAADARVTRIIIDQMGNVSGDLTYNLWIGRAFGELDPNDAPNAIVTDLALAPLVDGKAQYITSFALAFPKDAGRISGLMWHDVPNRGGRLVITGDLRAQGDLGLSSGWQGDNAGATTVPPNAGSLVPVTPSANEWVKTPVLTGVTGQILGRIINRGGTNQPLNVMGNPIPYFPANSADNSDAVLKEHLHETITGVATDAACARLPRQRPHVRPGQALPARLYGEGSVRARRRHRGVP